MNLELLYAKDSVFRLISQFNHPIKKDDGDDLYIYNYCESALESAFRVLGIKDDYIELMDFCKMREDNSRSIWAINFPDKPFDGITADIYYEILKNDYESWEGRFYQKFDKKDALVNVAKIIMDECGSGGCPFKEGCDVYSDADCIARIVEGLKEGLKKESNT